MLKERGIEDWRQYGKKEGSEEMLADMDAWLEEITAVLVKHEAEALGVGAARPGKAKDCWSEEFAALKKLHQEATKVANLVLWERIGRATLHTLLGELEDQAGE